jgi:hypothetical protein
MVRVRSVAAAAWTGWRATKAKGNKLASNDRTMITFVILWRHFIAVSSSESEENSLL